MRKVIAAAVVVAVLAVAGFFAVGAWRSDSKKANPPSTTETWEMVLRAQFGDYRGRLRCGRPPYKDCPRP